ncbi:MAG: AraC family transcriptional regulator [Peptoniphilaceae bacterium]|nr:AraC family transcriptional regulator [Peptoniphilaceae bacterium]MDY3738053.1 AraC family transcriptional regulator [Peptoniphilaceae bacterium]
MDFFNTSFIRNRKSKICKNKKLDILISKVNESEKFFESKILSDDTISFEKNKKFISLEIFYKNEPRRNIDINNLYIYFSRFFDKIMYKTLTYKEFCNITEEILNIIKKEDENKISEMENSLKYIYKNYNKKICLNEMCLLNYMGRTKFSECFKTCTGMNLNSFLQDVKINYAEYKILTTEKSIKEICKFTGYKSFSGFCRLFKRKKGINPSKIRKYIY